MHVDAGRNIGWACEQLARAAPAFMIFNDIRVEAHGGETPSELCEQWNASAQRLRAQLDEAARLRGGFGPAMRAEVFARLLDLMDRAVEYNESLESGSTEKIANAVCDGLEAMCQFARAKKRLQP
jgi:hypothetical protein